MIALDISEHFAKTKVQPNGFKAQVVAAQPRGRAALCASI